MKQTDKEEFLSLLKSYQGIIHKVNLVYFSVLEDRKDNFQEAVYNMWKAYSAIKNRASILTDLGNLYLSIKGYKKVYQ